MRLNRTRHFVLKKLSQKFIDNNENENNKADVVGLSFNEIDALLKVTKKKRELILSELDRCNEIVFYELEQKGFFIEPKIGLSALSEKKYLRKNEDIIIKWLKNIVQIFIPIASLLIAYLALTIKINSNNNLNSKQMKIIEMKIKKIEKELIENN